MDPYLLERYDRQIRISGWNQESLLNASVLIVGVGATGCELAKNLCLAGVGRIILVDKDLVELSNLNRQMLFVDADIGKQKVFAAKEKLERMVPHIKIEAYHEDIRRIPEDVIKDVNVICSCLDNWPTRRWLNSLAIELNKPLVDMAIEGFYGNVQVVIPRKTACLECYGDVLIPKEDQMAECTLRRRKPEDLANDLKNQGIDISIEDAKRLFDLGIKTIYDIKYAQMDKIKIDDCAISDLILKLRELLIPKLPAIQSIASTIAGIASTEVIKILQNGSVGDAIEHLLVYDGVFQRLTKVKLRRRKDCFVCGDLLQESLVEITVDLNESVWSLKERISSLFSIPDPEIQYKRWILKDDQKLSEINVKNDEILYIHTSRRYMPIQVKVKVVEDSHRT